MWTFKKRKYGGFKKGYISVHYYDDYDNLMIHYEEIDGEQEFTILRENLKWLKQNTLSSLRRD